MKEYIVQEETVYGRHGAYEILNTANKVELIRCKDCKFQVDRGRRYPECDKHFLLAKDDWFCADGERK